MECSRAEISRARRLGDDRGCESRDRRGNEGERAALRYETKHPQQPCRFKLMPTSLPNRGLELRNLKLQLPIVGVFLLILAIPCLSGIAAPAAGGPDSPLPRVAFLRDGDVYVYDGSSGLERRVTTDGGYGAPWWASDGESLLFRKAISTTSPQMWRWRADMGVEPAGDSPIREHWAPDGAAVAIMEPQLGRWQPDPAWMETRVWVEEDSARRPISPPEVGVRWEPLAWSPTGDRLALLRLSFDGNQIERGASVPVVDASLWVTEGDLQAPTLRELVMPTTAQRSPGVPDVARWSPDGRYLTLGMGPAIPCNSCRADGALWQAVPVDGGAPVELGSGLTAIPSVDWAADGAFVVLSAPAGRETYRGKQLVRVDPATGDATDLSRDPAWADLEPAVSPDGRVIAFARGQALDAAAGDASANRTAILSRRIWVMDADGGNPRQLTDAPGWTDEAPVWSSDGQWLIFVRWCPAGEGEPAAAQIWAMRPDGSVARMLVSDLDVPPGLESGFGYYGALAWQDLFSVAP